MMNGNEAVARGAFEAGVKVAAGYPGTPSTEVMDYTHHAYPDIYCEWSTNEKVAVEVAIGASFAGYRSFALMKTVGLNVAADALAGLPAVRSTAAWCWWFPMMSAALPGMTTMIAGILGTCSTFRYWSRVTVRMPRISWFVHSRSAKNTALR
jgi:hypothetical protein